MKIALAGNPNSGKTTLFNALTGSNQFVGNWPGVTVEKKEGKLKGHPDVTIMDLPGIYSLSPYTLEEVVARDYLIGDRPDAVLNIVDGTNLERNLYLSTQLVELGIPVVMAVNMMDIVQKNGDQIHMDRLSRELGCPVVEISALKGTGVREAAELAVKAAQAGQPQQIVHTFDKKMEQALTAIEDQLVSVPAEQKRFFAIKLLNGTRRSGAGLRTSCRQNPLSADWKRSWTMIPRASSPMSVTPLSRPSSGNAAKRQREAAFPLPIRSTESSRTGFWRCPSSRRSCGWCIMCQ